jgi:hypothetical protein
MLDRKTEIFKEMKKVIKRHTNGIPSINIDELERVLMMQGFSMGEL